jgi:TRAP-type C4-dicarboxylate transport system substrate-binding protein
MSFPGATAQKEWCERVEKRSGGRVKIKYYAGGKLYRYKPSERAIASGALDMGQFGVFQIGFICQAVMLPGLFDEWGQVKKFHEQGGSEILRRGLVSARVRNLFALPAASITAISSKPIRSIEEISKLKMRSPTPQLIDFLGKLGASNVHVATGEVYQALQLGVIDGVVSTTNSFLLRKWHEPAKYFLDTTLGLIPHYAIINLDKWNKLPKDIQKIMLDTGKEIEDEMYATVKDDDDQVRKQLRENLETYVLSPQEYARWSERARLVWEDWSKQGPEYVEALKLSREIIGK